jgi:hypothetical protein
MLDAIANNTLAILLTFTLFSSCEDFCNCPEIGKAVPQRIFTETNRGTRRGLCGIQSLDDGTPSPFLISMSEWEFAKETRQALSVTPRELTLKSRPAVLGVRLPEI